MDPQIVTYLPIFRKQLEKFVVFNDEEWSIFASYLKIRTVKKKDHIIESGHVCKEIGFIVSGSLRYYHVKDGQEITNYFCLDNEFVSSYRSFLQQAPGHANIQALEDVLLITFTHQNIQQLLANPLMAYKMERFGRLIAEYLICCYEERVISFITLTPEERYMALLESDSRLIQRIPQHYLATYLGITPVSLSRIRKRMFEVVK